MNKEVASPSNHKEFSEALVSGDRYFYKLELENLNGVNLNLSNCKLIEVRFREARLSHANFSNAILEGSCFQKALLWGADLSSVQAFNTYWQEAETFPALAYRTLTLRMPICINAA